MNSATEAVAAALAAGSEPWFPGLAPALARSSPGWTSFDEGRAYGTVRWLAGDAAGIRVIVDRAAIGGAPVLVERLPDATSEPFRGIGITDEVGPDDLRLIRAAASLIGLVPPLALSVGALVRSLHVLRAENGYDVSHSEPTLPFSIFVSVPDSREADPVLRLAESIIHEAMHLQLTLVENALPLVATDGLGWSPWQCRDRPVGGLLHGLYVFSVIARFMDAVASAGPELAAKAARRRIEIGEEVATLGDFDRHLTMAGSALRLACLRAFGP